MLRCSWTGAFQQSLCSPPPLLCYCIVPSCVWVRVGWWVVVVVRGPQVYETYINMMNDRIRDQFECSANPFHFKFISNLRGMERFDDTGPCVVMASPGMMQSGLSRELFELWCSNPSNGVVVTGYCVEGTLARVCLFLPESLCVSVIAYCRASIWG